MSRIRELMRDKRVAAGVAVTAVLFSVYRISGIGTETEPAAVTAPAPEQAPAALPQPAGPAPAGAFAAADSAPPAAAPSAALPAEVAWSWDWNPFLPKGARDAGRGEKAAAPAGGVPDAMQTAGAGSGDVPGELRGTVVSGGSGLAIFGTRLVPRGDRIGEWTVERVEHARVVLRRGAEVRVLDIFKAAHR